MQRRSAYVGLAWFALAAACSAEPEVGSTATALDFCKTFSAITADKAGRCLKMAPAVVALASSGGDAYCRTVQSEVDAGRVVYDAAKGGACARSLPSLAPCAFLVSSGQPFPAECSGVLTGAVAPGGPCSTPWTALAAPAMRPRHAAGRRSRVSASPSRRRGSHVPEQGARTASNAPTPR